MMNFEGTRFQLLAALNKRNRYWTMFVEQVITTKVRWNFFLPPFIRSVLKIYPLNLEHHHYMQLITTENAKVRLEYMLKKGEL